LVFFRHLTGGNLRGRARLVQDRGLYGHDIAEATFAFTATGMLIELLYSGKIGSALHHFHAGRAVFRAKKVCHRV
jgi:hypothetical protein